MTNLTHYHFLSIVSDVNMKSHERDSYALLLISFSSERMEFRTGVEAEGKAGENT